MLKKKKKKKHITLTGHEETLETLQIQIECNKI